MVYYINLYNVYCSNNTNVLFTCLSDPTKTLVHFVAMARNVAKKPTVKHPCFGGAISTGETVNPFGLTIQISLTVIWLTFRNLTFGVWFLDHFLLQRLSRKKNTGRTVTVAPAPTDVLAPVPGPPPLPTRPPRWPQKPDRFVANPGILWRFQRLFVSENITKPHFEAFRSGGNIRRKTCERECSSVCTTSVQSQGLHFWQSWWCWPELLMFVDFWGLWENISR